MIGARARPELTAVGLRDGRREAWHLGGQEGVSTALYIRRDGGPVVAILTNLQHLGTNLLDLARQIADLVEAEPGSEP